MYKMVQKAQYKLKINILGLRNLESNGILPVQRAFTQIELSSLFDMIEKKACEDIQTQPRQKGSNPNFNFNLQMNLKLPIDEKYRPNLPGKVYDQVFTVRNPSLIGTFKIDITKLIDADNKFKTAYLDNLNKLTKKLNSLLSLKSAAASNLMMKDQNSKPCLKLPAYKRSKIFQSIYLPVTGDELPDTYTKEMKDFAYFINENTP